MEIDYTPVYIGIGVGLGSLVAWKMRKAKSLIDLDDATYHEAEKKLTVHLKNASPHDVYAKPAVRKIVGAKEEEVTSSYLSYMTGSRSQRMLYDLITESNEPVKIPANAEVDLIFHLEDDPDLEGQDFLYIDSSCGSNPQDLKSTVAKTIPVKVRHGEVVAQNQKKKVKMVDTAKIMQEVEKTDSIQPVVDAHPHLKDLICSVEVELKPIHGLILHLAEVKGKLNAGEVSKLLGKSKSTVNNHLRMLYRQNLLERVKEGRAFSYQSLNYAIEPAG